MDVIDSWRLALDSEGRSPKTISLYVSAARSLTAYTGKGLEQTTATDLRGWLIASRERWSTTTLSINFRALRVAFRWLVDENEIDRNPIERVKPPKVEDKLPRVASQAEVDALLKSIPVKSRRLTDVRDRALIAVLADSGTRRGEVLGLRVEHVDLAARRLVVTGKVGTRTVPLSARACAALDRYLRVAGVESGALWRSQGRGGVLGETGLRLMLKRRCARAGVREMNPHSFRHGLVDKWLSSGGSELGIRDVCGWNSNAMVAVYARGNRQARAASEFGRIIG